MVCVLVYLRVCESVGVGVYRSMRGCKRVIVCVLVSASKRIANLSYSPSSGQEPAPETHLRLSEFLHMYILQKVAENWKKDSQLGASSCHAPPANMCP